MIYVRCPSEFRGDLIAFLDSYGLEWTENNTEEKIKSGLIRAQILGRKSGRPRVRFDYETLLSLYRKGMSFKEIADKMGKTPSSCHRAIFSIPIDLWPAQMRDFILRCRVLAVIRKDALGTVLRIGKELKKR